MAFMISFGVQRIPLKLIENATWNLKLIHVFTEK